MFCHVFLKNSVRLKIRAILPSVQYLNSVQYWNSVQWQKVSVAPYHIPRLSWYWWDTDWRLLRHRPTYPVYEAYACTTIRDILRERVLRGILWCFQRFYLRFIPYQKQSFYLFLGVFLYRMLPKHGGPLCLLYIVKKNISFLPVFSLFLVCFCRPKLRILPLIFYTKKRRFWPPPPLTCF